MFYKYLLFFLKSCTNLWSVARSMTKYLLHGRTCDIAELLPRALIHTRATILQCRMPYHAISIYCQVPTNLVD